MRTLYHLWIMPDSRKVRVVLKEKGLDFQLVTEKFWERRVDFLKLNPAGELPVLVDEDGAVIAGGQVIAEYLDELHPDKPLLGFEPHPRAETRRLVNWFDAKFAEEVTANLVGEKLLKRYTGRGQPNTSAIRAGQHNLKYHLDYIAYLSERRSWLAGEEFSLADIAAAVQLSCVDYLGDIPWEDHPKAKDWYVRIKSRPSFRPLLADRMPGWSPPPHYDDLDF